MTVLDAAVATEAPAAAVPTVLDGVPPAELDASNAALRRLIMGYIVSQCVMAVTELGVPDALAAGPRPVTDLAAELGADVDALDRALSTLVTERVFEQPSAGVYGLTPTGALLCSNTPGSLSHLCTLMGGEAYDCWAGATYALRTGRPAFDERFGDPYFDWLEQRPAEAHRFHRAQAGLVELRLLPLVELDWSTVDTVVDVGAGDGTLLSTVLEAHPHLRGTAVDLPAVMPTAAERFSARGLGERTTCVPGDFFASVPSGGDRYVMSQILHDWPDDRAVEILRVCRAAMPAHAELVVVEQIVPDDHRPHPARLLDLHMLALLGGRERTATRWRELLSAAGLRLATVSTGSRSSLLVAVPC